MAQFARNEEASRVSPRRHCGLRGILSFGDYRSRISCSIMDMSSTGAGLSMTHEDEAALRRRLELAPSQPVMLILPSDRTCVEAMVAWCAGGKLGLRFVSAFEAYHGRI